MPQSLTNSPSPREIFTTALGIADPAQRQEYLDQACGPDAALREQVARLLAAAQTMPDDNPLDAMVEAFGPESTANTATVLQSSNGRLPQREIGPYKLLEQIGEGGFGTVYMAEQTVPLRRKVALKILKPGMGTKEILARFEAERQALAIMDHPNIARVLDAGSTAEGLPYFVMELVRGTPVTEYCDEARLTTQERLILFVDICRAVQHAHQKGIIHRDLKPTNVLVTMHDDRAVPKVIDFGIAKALNQQLTDRTLFTGYQQMLGTPLYMSPEQAQMSGIDVDTRSDVYSLGVLLYELLTGTTPFDRESIKYASYDDLRRIIREQEPPRPSHRLTTLDAASRSTAADKRKLDERKISDELRGELDWIVMKALEKDRNRRYQSATELAEDIHRYLSGEPVEACPPSTLYRLRKQARRNTRLIATASLVLLTAIVGTAVSLRYARTSAQAAERARNAQTRAEQHARAAEEANRQSEILLYAADMKLVSEAMAGGDIPRAAELLRRHIPRPGRPDLRGFEWHYFHNRIAVPPDVVLQPGGWIDDLDVSPDGRWLATTAPGGRVDVYDVGTWTKHREFPTQAESVEGVCWSPDGLRLAAACADGKIRIWDFGSGELQLSIAAHPEYASDVAFSPDGSAVYSCGDEPFACKWDAMTGRSLLRFCGHNRELSQLAVSSDGQFLATAAGDRTFALWEAETGRRLQTHLTDTSGGRVVAVAFSPDNGLLAAANIFGAVDLMETKTGAVTRLMEHPDGIESLAFLKGGRRLAMADRGGALHLHPVSHDSEPGEALPTPAGARWEAHNGRALTVAITPDGKRLISGGRDGAIRVWSTDSDAGR